MQDKCKATLQEAEALYAAGFYNGAANRAYYAAYQRAMAFFGEANDKDHGRMHALVAMNFRNGRNIIYCYTVRKKADYEPEFVTAGEANTLIGMARAILTEIDKEVGGN
jgi:uncharacterized protein (UPF0332 family)